MNPEAKRNILRQRQDLRSEKAQKRTGASRDSCRTQTCAAAYGRCGAYASDTQKEDQHDLKQNFKAEQINRVWVSDFTYIPTDEGWLYLCSILDVASRRVVGWAASSIIDRHLALSALDKAVEYRKPAKGFIFHSDRGCQYASSDFRNAVAGYGGIQSMSAKGCPYDNACAESFFKSIKVECLNRYRFSSRAKAEEVLSRYMLFYNRKRIHATLNYLCPADFEANLPLAS